MFTEVLLVHAVSEYMLQPEVVLAQKRTPNLVGVAQLVVHAAIPAAACFVLGLVPLQTAGLLLLAHALADGPVVSAFLAFVPVQSVANAMTHPDHEKWPIQVQALQFSLAASHEKAFWATSHAVAIYAALALGSIL